MFLHPTDDQELLTLVKQCNGKQNKILKDSQHGFRKNRSTYLARNDRGNN